MKRVATPKRPGLSSKRWREASRTRGPAYLVPQPKPPKDKVHREKSDSPGND